MPFCDGCGFDSVPDHSPCPLCGADASAPTAIDPDSIEVTVRGGRAQALGEMTAPGSLFVQRYHVEKMIGRGGMGTVYEVTDTETGHHLALKILHRDAASDESGLARFKREVAILSKLRHPAIPRIFDWGMESGELYFVAELISGSDLRALSRLSGAWDTARACAVAAAVADALSIAHEHGIIHRDVKPHNIMIAQDGSVRLLDFGIARGAGIDMNTITVSGALVGTPEYMSPEQFATNRVDARSDVYSLGIVLFEMLTAQRPFLGDTPLSIGLKHTIELPPPPRSLRKDLPMWLERIVLRCLEKDPARRFQSAADLALELRRPRSNAVVTRRRLTGGDWVVEDESETSDWALVLSSPTEKKGWTPGFALRFADQFYELVMGERDATTGRWLYRFSRWPAEEILRGHIDYEEYVRTHQGTESLKDRFRNLLK